MGGWVVLIPTVPGLAAGVSMGPQRDLLAGVGRAPVWYDEVSGSATKHPTVSSQMSGNPYTAVIRRDGRWWIGWVEEVPGVNSQGETREELLANLREALSEAIEMNREEARKAAGEQFEEVSLQP